MSTLTDQDPPDWRSLWGEALWGVGLIGAIVVFIVALVTLFGR
jgi:hypothetical protein